MCSGIALALSELPAGFVEQHGLQGRVHERGGEPEVRFLFRAAERLLPVWLCGQLRLARWGCRRGDKTALPLTGWTWQETVDNGWWGLVGAEPVDVPATMAVENGIWYAVRQGLRGLLVRDESGRDVVYLVCEPASHYYSVMTRSGRMPVLIGERI
jgi:hypothetical protein